MIPKRIKRNEIMNYEIKQNGNTVAPIYLDDATAALLKPGNYELIVSEDPKPWPQMGDDYWVWYIIDEKPRCQRWNNDCLDRSRRELGEILRTSELCSADHSRRVAHTALIKRRDELGGFRSLGDKWQYIIANNGGYWHTDISSTASEFSFENEVIGNQFCSEMSAELTAFFGPTPEQSAAKESEIENL